MGNKDSNSPDDNNERPVVNYYRIISLFSLFSHGNNNGNNSGNGSFVNHSTQVKNSGRDVEVKLSGKEAKVRGAVPRRRRSAAIWGVHVIITFLLVTGTPEATLVIMLPERENEFTVLRGYATCKLPNGTKVTLPKGSIIRYIAAGFEGCGEVFLSGEASFAIPSNVTTPLIIRSQNGTMLTVVMDKVSARNAFESMKIVVTERGEVIVFDESRTVRGRVETGEKAEYYLDIDEIKVIERGEVPTLQFDNVTLAEVALILGKEFDIEIVAEASVRECRVHAAFYKNGLKLTKVLTDLRMVTNQGMEYSFSADGRSITLKGQCNGSDNP
ncbi:DUF4974 domain-containing protein [Dawidia soli]|uniref:Protein FecR C-terminal domain-containing protein n=1 Tax=Dawidia soli TaxID=2782352 RepID=A0AAP2GF90_9BACT|nr:DUF4974 domain-containing protein [Dawidia soli]MBT1689242.1 hypothetical protein [Dawidia soli]